MSADKELSEPISPVSKSTLSYSGLSSSTDCSSKISLKAQANRKQVALVLSVKSKF